MKSQFWTIWVPVGLVVLATTFGTFGFHEVVLRESSHDGWEAWRESFFLAAGLPIVQTTTHELTQQSSSIVLNFARALGILLPPYAFFLIVLGLFHGRLARMKIIWWELTHQHHVIVCGSDVHTENVVADLRATHCHRIVLIVPPAASALTDPSRFAGCVILIQDPSSPEVLQDASLKNATAFYALADDDETNDRIARQVNILAVNSPRRQSIKCVVHIRSPLLRRILSDSLRRNEGAAFHSVHAHPLGGFDFIGFDAAEVTARMLLDQFPLDRFRPDDSAETGRVVIVGDGEMAQTLLVEILQQAHYRPGKAVNLAWLVEDSQKAKQWLLGEAPCMDAEYRQGRGIQQLCEGIFPSLAILPMHQADCGLLDDVLGHGQIYPSAWLSVYVCLPTDSQSRAYAEFIRQGCKTDTKDMNCHIYWYSHDPFMEALTALDGEVRPFSAFLGGCSVDAIEGRAVDDLAKQFHEEYRRSHSTHNIGPWDSLSEDNRNANRHAADHIAVKLRAVGLHRKDLSQTEFTFTEAQSWVLAEVEHRRWCAEKLLAGMFPLPRTPQNQEAWKANKPAFQAARQHLCLCLWSELTDDEKREDKQKVEAIPKILHSGRAAT